MLLLVVSHSLLTCQQPSQLAAGLSVLGFRRRLLGLGHIQGFLALCSLPAAVALHRFRRRKTRFTILSLFHLLHLCVFDFFVLVSRSGHWQCKKKMKSEKKRFQLWLCDPDDLC